MWYIKGNYISNTAAHRGCDTSKLLSDDLKNKLYYDCFQKMLYHYSHHKIHRNSDRITVDLSVASFRRACGNRRIHGAEMEIAAAGFMVPLPAARQVSQDTPSPVSQTAGGGAS